MDSMAQFQPLFLKTAAEHLHAIADLLQEYSQQDQQYRDQLHLHAHSLKGEANAMQYKTFGEYITVLEKFIKQYKDTQTAIPDDTFAFLQTAVTVLTEELHYIAVHAGESNTLPDKQVQLENDLQFTVV